MDFNLDGFWLPDQAAPAPDPEVRYETVIIERNERRIVTRGYTRRTGQREWSPQVTVYPRYDPPTTLLAEKIGLRQRRSAGSRSKGKAAGHGIRFIARGAGTVRGARGDRRYVGPPQLGNPELGSGIRFTIITTAMTR